MSWRGVAGARSPPPRPGTTRCSPGPDAVPRPPPGRHARRAARPRRARSRSRTSTASIRCPVRSPGTRDHVLGVQANLWTEHVRTEERAAYMTYPRAAALAEVGWSPAARLDWASFRGRLPAQFARYRALGVPLLRRRVRHAARASATLRAPHEPGPQDLHRQAGAVARGRRAARRGRGRCSSSTS